MNRGSTIAVGFMTVLGIALFFVSIAFLGRWHNSKDGLELKLRFQFLNNLAEGASVEIAGGIVIGYVNRIYQENLNIYVDVLLDGQYKNRLPRQGTQFAIYTEGLMGQKYINVILPSPDFIDSLEVPEDGSSPFLQDNEIIDGVDPPSIDQMLLTFTSWFEGKNGGQVLAEIMQETRSFIGSLNSIASENRSDIRKTIQRARSSFEKLSNELDLLMTRLNLLTQNVTEISNRNKQDIQAMLKNLSLISQDLNLITQRVNSGRGNIGKFLKDEKLYKNANAAVENARSLFEILKRKPWMIMYKEN